MNLNQAVMKRVEEILKQKLMSYYRLEINSGVTHSTMQKLKSADRTGCNLKTIFLLIYGLGVTPEEFFASPLFKEENIQID